MQRAKSFVRQQKLGEISESLLAVLQDLKSKDDASPIDRVVIKSGGRIYFLKTDEIDWVEGAGDYLTLHSGSQTHLIRETMGNFYATLDRQKFLRIHRSTIVNIERIKDIRPVYKGEYVITLTSGVSLKASRGYRHEIQSLVDQAR